ncbi:MAG TPA: GGDEF domain-containing protein [Accumulibacter sp.]|uniref:GGDEF domain-containing protein n=1 Tax=Accumulibacter sp. TaxID=2053492 RepID=UPI0025F73C06|nr:GGDEF domain-containing protein [Accumulibacter sp.]MCM8599267.1 GGDEF domain-containing protein [Accumulibacter sp.]MCM8664685.1 GGDEF domain-containing protein [Accumulibacter sp.]HNC53397.1 GGDEF domain-containing protein [Accumulibacter sp.]
MSSSPHHLPLVDLRADDGEIGNYAALLDSLHIGLLVFAADGSPWLRNGWADALLGSVSGVWEDENGQPLATGNRPETQVLQTGQAVLQRAICVRNDARGTRIWCKASAFPVFAADGSLRRVLLTLAELDRHSRLATENRPLPTHDPLTGVFNQRYILLLVDDESRRARRYGIPFALALIAIDNFPDFCRAHGSGAGESVLAEIGRLLGNGLREFDMVGRFGAEEFLVILPNVRVSDAMIGLERLRELVEATRWYDHEPALTISGGVSEYGGEDAATLIECLRSLLGTARTAGGNRLCVDLEMF